MKARIGLALWCMLTIGATSAAAQEEVPRPADSLAVAPDIESRFGLSWVLGTLGSAGGTVLGGYIGALGEGTGEYDQLFNAFFGAAVGGTIGSGLLAAVGARNHGAWPYLGSAIGCVAGVLILQSAEGTGWLLYFPIQGFVAAAFAQIGR